MLYETMPLWSIRFFTFGIGYLVFIPLTWYYLGEEIFTLKRFKPFGGKNPTSAVKLLYEQPEKFRPTPAEENFKPLWKNPPQLKVDLGKMSTQQWRNAVVENAQKVNPAYSKEEIIAKFGFDRIIGLGSGWFGRNG